MPATLKPNQKSSAKRPVPSNLLDELSKLAAQEQSKNTAVPSSVSKWFEQTQQIEIHGKAAEWSPEEVYVALARPGGDACCA